jgi:hypothetical protein
MFRKAVLGALVLAAAAGGPAVFYVAPNVWRAASRQWSRTSQTPSAEVAAPDPLPPQPAGQAPMAPLEGAPLKDLAEVFRFDVTTGWVLRRWPRVSTGLADLPMQGYRVPLVTGTAETDLAGSLTYYFGPQQKVERITFQGTTGDARELVRLLSSRYNFARRLTNDPGLFVYEVPRLGGEPTSVLQVRSAPVVTAGQPHGRFEVDLVIERPEA